MSLKRCSDDTGVLQGCDVWISRSCGGSNPSYETWFAKLHQILHSFRRRLEWNIGSLHIMPADTLMAPILQHSASSCV